MSSSATFRTTIRMVERQSVGGARAAVVAGQEEAVMAERGHHLHLIASHGAERVVDVLRATVGRADAVAIAAEVGRDHVVSTGEGAGDLVPADVRLRVAVQQQERRPLAAMAEEDLRAVGANPPGFEAREQAAVGRELVASAEVDAAWRRSASRASLSARGRQAVADTC